MRPLTVLASGMVTNIGLTGAATRAALRAMVSNFAETRFLNDGAPQVGATVDLRPPYRGLPRLVHLVAPAIQECLAAVKWRPEHVPLLMCVSEAKRPGRPEDLDARILAEVGGALGVRFHAKSVVIARGRVGATVAVDLARRLCAGDGVPGCLVAGTDSLLNASTLAEFGARNRLLTEKNSDGFIPGEAGAAVILGPAAKASAGHLVLRGVGLARESATIDSEEPLRGVGLAAAVRGAMNDGGVTLAVTDYRLTDLSGIQYYFKEASLALSRTLRQLKPEFRLWHTADCIGEVGAAIGPIVLGYAAAASSHGFAPGPGVLCHFSNEDDERAAMIWQTEQAGE